MREMALLSQKPAICEYDFFGRVAVTETLSEFEDSVVPFLSETFGAQSVLIILFHQNSRPTIHFRWIPDLDVRRTFDEIYAELGFMLDPFYHQCWKTKDWDAFLLRDIAPDRFESSQYFSDYFGATKMVDDMGLVARLSPNSAVHLSVGRNAGQRRYRASDLKKFMLTAKVLVPKLRKFLQRDAQGQHARTLPLENQFSAICAALDKPITPRESEIAALITRGHSSRSIALNLGISPHTVKVHRRTLYKKLGISSQIELFGLLTRYFKRV